MAGTSITHCDGQIRTLSNRSSIRILAVSFRVLLVMIIWLDAGTNWIVVLNEHDSTRTDKSRPLIESVSNDDLERRQWILGKVC